MEESEKKELEKKENEIELETNSELEKLKKENEKLKKERDEANNLVNSFNFKNDQEDETIESMLNNFLGKGDKK